MDIDVFGEEAGRMWNMRAGEGAGMREGHKDGKLSCRVEVDLQAGESQCRAVEGVGHGRE